MAHARLVPAGSTGDVVVIIDDDEDHKTQRMQATHFRAVVEGGLPITPALLESIDWYAEADAAAEQARMAPRAPEAFLDELGRARPEDGTAKPASRSPGSCGTAPEMARSPEERPSTPPLERVTGPQLPPARSHAVLRLLMSMIVLAIVGFVIGFVIAT